MALCVASVTGRMRTGSNETLSAASGSCRAWPLVVFYRVVQPQTNNEGLSPSLVGLYGIDTLF